MQIERITYERFGATSNIYHKPILVPCSVCRERDKAVPAYWISLCGTLKGNWAEVIGELGSHYSFVVRDAETEELSEVYKNEQWTICPADSPTSGDQKPVGWARSLDNFMGIAHRVDSALSC